MKISRARDYNRFAYFESLPKFPLDKPCITIASKYAGSKEQQLLAEERASKKKWITAKGFKTYLGGKANAMGAKEKYTDFHYINLKPGPAPHEIKARREDPSEYLFGHFK